MIRESQPKLGSLAPHEHPSPILEPGAAVGPVWIVEEPLGEGGMGTVYRCHNRHASKIVAAVKLLDPSFQHNPEARGRFLREAEILSGVDHPNIVRVSDVNLDTHPPYLVMDFIEGESLEEMLHRRGPFPPDEAVELCLQMAEALRALHLQRIYHRDIKPANILVTPDGTLKLVDFGLAVQQGSRRITTTNIDFGTVTYCPPEWGSDAELDPASWDLYALGVVLFEMITGTVAFPTSHDLELTRQIIHIMTMKQGVPYLELGPRFEPNLRWAVRKLTGRAPEDRFTDAKELIATLEAYDPAWIPSQSIRPATEAPPEPRDRNPMPPLRLDVLQWVAFFGLMFSFLLLGLVLGIGLTAAVFLSF